MTRELQAAFDWTAGPGPDLHGGTLPGVGGFIVRRTAPADEPALIRLLESVSSDEIRLRFFGHIHHFSHALTSALMRSDEVGHLSLVALRDDGSGTIVANAMLVPARARHEAEFAVLVHHDVAHHGLGRHLIECLLEHARRVGIKRVYGLVLRDNFTMLELAREMGFSLRTEKGFGDCLRVEIPVAPALP